MSIQSLARLISHNDKENLAGSCVGVKKVRRFNNTVKRFCRWQKQQRKVNILWVKL